MTMMTMCWAQHIIIFKTLNAIATTQLFSTRLNPPMTIGR